MSGGGRPVAHVMAAGTRSACCHSAATASGATCTPAARPRGAVAIGPRFAASVTEIRPFNDGSGFYPMSGGRVGLVDRSGSFVIEPSFDWAGSFAGVPG